MTERRQPPRARKGTTGGDITGNEQTNSSPRKRVTKASDLTLEEQLAVLNEATELPPFGFNIAGLEQRLERRLGFEITQVRVENSCLRDVD